MKISFTLNDKRVSPDVDPMARLLDVLRSEFGLTGVKEGCGEGECGACSILLDGRLANSCLILMGAVAERSVQTVEALAQTPVGRVVVDSIVETGGVQCGFCTPGFVVAAEALLRDNPAPTEDEITQGLSGNLCRCTGYRQIFEAIRIAADRLAADGDASR